MTEKEKMIAGKIYDPSNQELMELRTKAHRLSKEYNELLETDERRSEIIKELGIDGDSFYLQGPVQFDYGCFTSIGANSYANFNFTCLDCCPVKIGENVFMGPNVSILTPLHPLRWQDRNSYLKPDGTPTDKEYASPITIGDNCWIAGNVTICGGATIGDGCVIGAGSVVTGDIPPNSLAVGVPCRVVREITEADALEKHPELFEKGAGQMDDIKMKEWKQKLSEFQKKTDAFFAGEIDKASYKGYSGYFGSYAQKGGQTSMLRLRTPAGRITKERLQVISDMLRKYDVPRLHFTTCQTIQLHDLKTDALYPLMEEALDNEIIIMGGGGDYPRNVMCSPRSGVEKGEYFDVMPYAEATADYALTLIDAEKMPRKLKIAFSNSPANVTHATYRDLGFVANADGTFDVYSAGGLGGVPKLGVRVAEHIEPNQILYYIKAMWLTFRAYGNYENRAKARTRYMQETLGGAENYRKAYLEKLQEVYDSNDDLSLPEDFSVEAVKKTGDGTVVSGAPVMEQKQEGLYTVAYHPIGGQPDKSVFLALCDLICDIPDAELRLAPDETAYIINLTGAETERVLEVIAKDNANSPFERSVSCIGASTCQVGVRDSQAVLRASVEAVRAAGIPANALPMIHISGCPSSCGTHQTSPIGFRGGVKKVDGKPASAFVLNIDGCELQGSERLGRELGAILDEDIPRFFVEVGQIVAESGMEFDRWYDEHADIFAAIAQKYIDA